MLNKSMLIELTNNVFDTSDRHLCVSRLRRFEKSMAANMLSAYYSRGCDSRELFSNLKISETDNFKKHLNKCNVIHIDIQRFVREAKDVPEVIELINNDIIDEWDCIFRLFKDDKKNQKEYFNYCIQ